MEKQTSGIQVATSYDEIFQDLENLKEGDMAVFDVDQVLLDPVDLILSGRGESIKTRYFEDIRNRLGQDRFDYLYSIIIRDRRVVRVDERLPDVLRKLHEKGVHVVALTAFWDGLYGVIPDMSQFRVQQLMDFGFDFSPNKTMSDYTYTTLESPRMRRHPRFLQGVLLTSHVSKGDTLAAYLTQHNISKPNRLTFIDDNLIYLNQVQNSCLDLGIPFCGYELRVATLEALSDPVNEAMAGFQFEYLEKNDIWLEDQKAKNLLFDAMSV